MRQIKIIGLVLLLFVGVFPYRDHQTDSGNLFFSATSQHTSPHSISSGPTSGIQLPNDNKIGCESPKTFLPVMASAIIQTNSITNLIRDKKNKVSFPYFPKAVTVVVILLLLLLFFYIRRITRYARYLASLFLLVGFAGNASAQSTQTFTSSGTFTVPAGVTSITVECWGGGGRGGSAIGDNVNHAGGGGGGGAYSKKIITVTPSSPYGVVVGIGGFNDTNLDGGDSYFFNAATVVGRGGKGVATNILTGGIGGSWNATDGTSGYSGGNGALGTNGNYGGGGGSSAGTGLIGTNGNNSNGGIAPAGGGNGGGGGTSNPSSGSTGIAPGGGGGGATKGTGNATPIGSDGADGQVVITWTVCSTPTAFSVTGGGSYCTGGTGVAIGLANSQTGVNYQLYSGASTVGTPVAGTGSTITFGSQTTAGTYTVVATRTIGGCTANMTGSAGISLNPEVPDFTGTISNATCSSSADGAISINIVSGPAVAFQNTDNDYIDLGTSVLSNRARFTVEGWVKFNKSDIGARMSLFGQNDAIEFGFIDANNIQCWTPNGGSLSVNISTYPSDNGWHHIAAVGNGTNIIIYIDGIQIGIGGGATGNYGNSAFSAKIGGGVWDAAGGSFTGQIKKVGMWSTALTPAFLATLASGSYVYTGLEAGLIAGYNFLEGAGTSLARLPAGTAGTFVNTPVWTNILTYSWTKTLDGSFSRTTKDITGLTTGQYNLTVSNGICTKTNSFTVGSLSLAPVVPIANAGSGAMCTQITANWSVAANATSYRLDVSTVNTFASYAAGYQDLNVGNVTTYTVTGLTAGTTYYYRVRAVNSCGASTNSNIISYATTAVIPAQPGTITGSQTPCIASSQIYSVTNVAGVTYTWAFPAGWTQTAGGTSNSVTVTVGAGSGNVQVTPSNSCGNGIASVQAVTVTATVGTPTAITISAGTEPTCQLTNGITTTTYATTATNNTGFNWSISNGAAGSIGAATGVMTWANGFSGIVNIQVTASGCNGPSSQVIKTVTITPTVGTPVFTLGATSIYCKGAGSVTYTATATNSTGITYILDALSLAGGNSIVAGTGVVNYVAGWSGPSIITATATGCNGPKISTHTVTINDAVPVSVSITASTDRVCAGTPVIYTATPTNGGITPAYQWKANGANVGTNSATYTYVPLNNDVVTCVLTSSNPCVSGNPATSNSVLMIPWITNNSLDFINGIHGTLCGTPDEHTDAVLTAPAGTIFINVGFASYGTPGGSCPSFTLNLNCNAATSQSVVEGYLLGNNSATFPVTNATFGDPCLTIDKRLYVLAAYAEPVCAGTLPGMISGSLPMGGDGSYTYLWESSTTGPTSGFAAASGINNTQNYTPGALAQTTWYRRKVLSGACSDYSAVILIKVTPLPVATFSYTATPYCSNAANPSPIFSGGGVAGTFSSTAGLVFVSTATGEVNLAASTAGTYTVTNTIAASGGCGVVTAISTITIKTLPVVTFSYTGSPYCSNAANPSPTFSGGGVAGTFSSTAGLSLIPATGQINLATSTAGTYTVTNTIGAAGGCGIVTATSSITIVALPVATISYAGTPFCTSVATAQPVTRTGTAGGTYTALPAGLTIDGASGAITPGGSTPGTYTVTYTIAPANGCGAVTVTTSVTITAVPTATINYAGTPWCKSAVGSQLVTITGTGAYTLGTYSALPAGLSIVAATGVITASSSTAGTYTVTYTIPASGGCAAIPVTTSVMITNLPVATFNYAGTPYCSNVANPSPTFSGGGVAGTFSSTAGLNFINIATGQINLATSIPGTYTVTNTIVASGGCALVSATSSVTLTALPVATFSYTGSPYCSNAANPSPTFTGGGIAGTFTSTPGLIINAVTGEVNLVTSTAGTYTVTNTIAAAGGCSPVIATSPITITKLPVATFNYAGTPYCSNATNPSPVFTGGGAAGTFSSTPSGLVFVNNSTGQVDMTLSAAGTYNVTNTIAAAGGCSIVTYTNTITLLPRPTVAADYCALPGYIRLTATGGATPTSYQWLSPLSGNTNTIDVDIVGIYGVTVTNGTCVEDVFTTVSNNLVTDGSFTNFNAASPAFTTEYTQQQAYLSGSSTGLVPEGYYAVNTSAYSNYPTTPAINGYHNNFHGRDHTNNTVGPRKFLMVNGSTTLIGSPARQRIIWQQTVSVVPGKKYYFSAYGMNLNPTSPAQLQFEVNTVAVGSIADLNSAPKPATEADVNLSNWVRFYSTPFWIPAAGVTSAVIRIINLNTTAGGNDFGLDDISFGTLDPFPAILTSAPSTVAQTVCINTPIVDITYSTTGATGAGIIWAAPAPVGITCVFANNVAKISGTPTVAGAYSYTMTLSGCGPTELKTGTLNVTPNASIASVTGTSPLCIAGTATYTANSVILGGGTGAWSSNNTAVATVSAAGLVTGVAAGTCDIIYTITGGCGGTKSAQKSVTISPNASIGLVTGTTPLCIAATANYTANPVNMGGSGTGAWSSSNIAVATVSASGLVTGVAAGTCNITYTITGGCGGTVSLFQTVTINPNASINSVTGSTPLCIGGTATYVANSVILGGGTGAWSSSDAAVATVSAAGLVTGVTAGTCNIIYTITGGCSGTKSAQQSVTISPNSSIGSVTGATPLCPVATATYTANSIVLSGGVGAWSSSNTAIATVSTVGLVTGVSAGTCNIIYTITGGCGGNVSVQQSISITQNASIASVTGTTPLCSGSTTNYLANTVNLGGNGTGAWSSSNNAVATVSSAGLVTGVSPGTCNIIYTITGGCGGTVSAQQPVTISPNASVGSVTGASPLCIAATSTYSGNAIVLSGGAGSWTSSSTAIATVSAAGLVTGVSAGTCNIIYTITGGCGGSVFAQLPVMITPSASIASLSGVLSICTGGTTTYSANGVVLSGGTGAWSSSNTGVATVDPITGFVTGVSAGTSDIIYTITGGCGGTKTALRTVTVAAPIPQTITGTTPLCIGSAVIWTSTTAGGTWTSATPAVATVDNVTGLVTGLTAGTSVITYAYLLGGCVNTAIQTVTISAPIAQTITGTTPLCIGASATWTSTTAGGTWSSATPGVATVDAVTGKVNGLTAGTSVITYSVTTPGGCVNTAVQTVTVTAPIAQAITGTTPLCIGTTATWTSTTSGGTWSSATPAVASVGGATGLVTGLSAGTSVITYSVTTPGGCVNTATKTVTVTAPITQAITEITPLCIGATATWTSTTSGGTWSSTTPAVASVDGVTGLVAGLTTGTSVITYSVTTLGGCVNTATQTVTISAPPTCSISGPVNVTEGSPNYLFTSTVNPTDNVNHSWSITGNGTISGSTNGNTVTVDAGAAGLFTLTDNISRLGCTSSCTYDVIVCGISPSTGSVANGTSTTYTAPGGMDSYAWSIAGNASITSGTTSQTLTVLAGNNCSSYTLTLTIRKGAATSICTQTISVTDNKPPTFVLLETAVSYCVNNIINAVYNPAPTDPDYDDLTTPRPEYYSQVGSEFDLDVAANNFNDNCCAVGSLVLHWRIVFSPTPNPADPAHALITKAPINDQIIKPSAYPGLEFPSDGVTFNDVTHKIFYWLVDCNGKISAEQLLNITIKPRPNLIKTTI